MKPSKESQMLIIISRWARHDNDCKSMPHNWTPAEHALAMSEVKVPTCTCGLHDALDLLRKPPRCEHKNGIANPRPWPDNPEVVTGECVDCRSTVSVTAT